MKEENPNNDRDENRDNVKVLNTPIRSTSASIGDVKLITHPYMMLPMQREFSDRNFMT